MSAFRPTPVAGGAPRNNILAPLHAVKMAPTKPVLSAEIISAILDLLPIPDLMNFARVSKRMQEMVYEDTRWVQRLRLMGYWNEAEARQRFEEGMRRKFEAQKAKQAAEQPGSGLDGHGKSTTGPTTEPPSITFFDANQEEERRKQAVAKGPTARSLTDGFEALNVTRNTTAPGLTSNASDPVKDLRILSTIRSIRGYARQEYGRVYGALAPFYFDIGRSRTHTDAILFRTYRDPEQQAIMLAQLQQFAKSDLAQGCRYREERLASMMGIFETAVLHEFEKGINLGDVDGRMRQYAHVMAALNGGEAGVELFIRTNPLFQQREQLGNPMDCINQASSNSIALTPSQSFFSNLSLSLQSQLSIIDRVFPPTLSVTFPLLERVGRDILGEYVTSLFDEAHTRSLESYLKAVSGIFEQTLRFATSLNESPLLAHHKHLEADLDRVLAQVFEPHIDLYLAEELEFFKKKADAEVSRWESQLSEQDASTEAFFMANVNRQADKRDFLSSFKKVVMMPVNALPLGTSSKPTSTSLTTNGSLLDPSHPSSASSTRPSSPGVPSRTLTPQPSAAPTTELAAKALLLTSRLEGIRSLFSIEVALQLIHYAKASLERTALFLHLGSSSPYPPAPPLSGNPPLSPSAEAAKLTSLTLFVLLLHTLGSRHIKPGFDTAVTHLSLYNPRTSHPSTSTTSPDPNATGVAPLVTFLELVSVGDLIQQMVDVFYETELVAPKIADRNDFLDPAVKEKKRFESMLDERVAAGLNHGIDVLMSEVEYLCATTQAPTDFNPDGVGLPSSSSPSASASSASISSGKSRSGTPVPVAAQKAYVPDLAGPTSTSQLIVTLVSSHTKMLVGSTDKHTLDVFNQEVGLRLFAALCKHLKRQRISVAGAMTVLSDMQHYGAYIATLRNSELSVYFRALREVCQIYLIGKGDAGGIVSVVAEGGGERWGGVFGSEEVLEFVERRADWAEIKGVVERGLYGKGCVVM